MESTVLVKAFGILEALAGHDEGKPLAKLAGEVGLTKPTVHRILKTLSGMGYIEPCGGGVYRQTSRLRHLVSGPDDRALLEAADAVLRDLHAETGETVNLGVLRHGRVVYLHVLESRQPLRRVAERDSTDPVHSTALGRAIVSQLPPARWRSLLGTLPRQARTPHTVIDLDALVRILEDARREGYAIERDQTDVGVTCIGAPLFDASGSVAGAVSLSVPTARAQGDESVLAQAVRRAADRITERLSQEQETSLCPVQPRN